MEPNKTNRKMHSSDDMALLADVIREAGAMALTYFRNEMEHWKKDDNSPVTEADIAVDQFLKQRLMAARPDYGWLSEETEDDDARFEKQRIWVVDPIDGTRSFLRGREDWTISIAIVEDGKPITAAVYHAVSSSLFSAETGCGAFVNQSAISTTDVKKLSGCRMAANTGAFHQKHWIDTWPDMKITSYNSMALRLCHVAQGQEDATLAVTSKKDWDLAAADLLVREAGGMITTLDGKPLVYNCENPVHKNIAAAGPVLHHILMGHKQAVR